MAPEKHPILTVFVNEYVSPTFVYSELLECGSNLVLKGGETCSRNCTVVKMLSNTSYDLSSLKRMA
jgi:hypothetical protein